MYEGERHITNHLRNNLLVYQSKGLETEKHTEPTMCAILFWYIREKVQKLFQDALNLPMERSYEFKAQDNIGWDIIIWGRVARHWNHWKLYYLKKGTFSKTGINWEISFIDKTLQI